jgi:DNA invertase Pin-like site-specific DNA recombinase
VRETGLREKVLRDLASLRENQDAQIRSLISSAARVGIRSEDIARALGISRATLWRRYRSNLSRREPPDRPAAV